MKKLIIASSMILTVVLLIFPLVGCSGSEYRLSKSERQEVIRIALNTLEVSETVEEEDQYAVRFMWTAIVWHDSETSEVHFFYSDEIEKRPDFVPESAVFYPGVTIYLGKQGALNVAVSLDMEQAVYVERLSVYRTPQR